MLIVLVIAIVLLIGSVILSSIVPHPITWLMTGVLALAIGLIIWPKYQAEQAANAQGQWVEASVVGVREWDRKIGDGNYKTQYEITAKWTHPDTQQVYQFTSPPLTQDPRPYLHGTIKVKVVWERPQQYVVDTSFLKQNNSGI